MRTQSLLSGAALGLVLSLAAGAPALAQDAPPATTITWKGAPEFSWGEFTFKPRGRVYLDYVGQDVDRATGPDFTASDSRIRTARLGVQGTWTDQWSYTAEVSINNGDANWEDLLLRYTPSDSVSVTVGNFKSLSLENLTSSRYTTFMERGAFADLIDAGRVMTLAGQVGGDNWSLAAGVHGDSINDADVAGDESSGMFARAHFAPVHNAETSVHLGGWVRSRERGDDTPFRYRVRNNTNFGDRYTDAGSSPLGAGESDTALGLEGAVVWRSLSLQGEWARVEADLTGGGEAEATGYYAFVSFFPTGERRRYDPSGGEFGRVSIRNPVTAGGPGAIELAARYDNVDLTEFAGVAAAGEYSAVTLGANWYPFPYVRFMANYTDARNQAQVPTADVDVRTFQLRAQFDF